MDVTARIAPGPGSGHHACWRYASAEERRSVLSAFLVEGIEAGERLAWLGPDGSEGELRELLDGRIDVDRLLADGGLQIASADRVMTRDRAFDAQARIRDHEVQVERAVADGYAGLRAFGEAGRVPAARDDLAAWTAYELATDRLGATAPFVALCGYDRREWSDDEFRPIDAVHREAAGGCDRPSQYHLHGTADGVALSGEVDIISAAELEVLLRGAADRCRSLVVDLADLSFIDGAGTTSLFQAARALGTIELRDPPSLLRTVWRLLGYDDVIPLAPPTGGRS